MSKKLDPEVKKVRRAEYQRRYLSSPEARARKNASTRARYAKNPEPFRRYTKKWIEENKEKARDMQRSYRARNKDKYKEFSRRNNGLPHPTRPEPKLCECCWRPERVKGKVSLGIDHDHVTGMFRGWLCHQCNVGLGLLGDTEASVLRALNYLRSRQCLSVSQTGVSNYSMKDIAISSLSAENIVIT